jgi:hypothetical protein
MQLTCGGRVGGDLHYLLNFCKFHTNFYHKASDNNNYIFFTITQWQPANKPTSGIAHFKILISIVSYLRSVDKISTLTHRREYMQVMIL